MQTAQPARTAGQGRARQGGWRRPAEPGAGAHRDAPPLLRAELWLLTTSCLASSHALSLPLPPLLLQNIRVVQPNLVYAVGLSLDICHEEALRDTQYFGQFGRTGKQDVARWVACCRAPGNAGMLRRPTCSVVPPKPGPPESAGLHPGTLTADSCCSSHPSRLPPSLAVKISVNRTAHGHTHGHGRHGGTGSAYVTFKRAEGERCRAGDAQTQASGLGNPPF